MTKRKRLAAALVAVSLIGAPTAHASSGSSLTGSSPLDIALIVGVPAAVLSQVPTLLKLYGIEVSRV
ncbi:hypothetical protein H0194_05760 [Corynebacterium incognita]|uniref:Secreted protein n=1 Tax=Corynebacterium incognita TaxID=2754725 RepID=A0A7G7CM11_9CORY|nr:hypothetical protein [Corynebacterium incognita]QNE88627.1 hypothetical protein H0194_05760 [Corynebacterium incognita]